MADDYRGDIEEHYHELLQHAQDVNDMSQSAGWSHLVACANDLLYKKGELILRGQVTDREDYIRETAWREGVLWVLNGVNRANQQVRGAREKLAELDAA